MKLNQQESRAHQKDRKEVMEQIDLSEVRGGFHTPGHWKRKLFGPLAILAMIWLVWFAWRLS